jgi:histone acetyltransferase (RNA polymerase elongator complex component)
MRMKVGTTELRARPSNNGSNLHWLVAVYDYNGEPSQAKLEQARAEYKRKYPWRQVDDAFNVIWVVSQRNKLQIERILRDRPARTALSSVKIPLDRRLPPFQAVTFCEYQLNGIS